MIDFYTKSKNVKDDLIYKIKYYTVKTAYNGIARNFILSFADRFHLLEVLQLQTLGTVKCSAKDRITVYSGSFKAGSLYINTYQVIT